MENMSSFLVAQSVVIVTGLISIYVKVSLKLKELEVRVNMVEKQDDIIAKKLDKIQEAINNLAISVQNKQDRE